VLERAAFHKFHDDKRVAGILADFVNGADVGMIQGGGGACFALKTPQSQGVAADGLGEEFEGDESAKLGIFGLMDDAHRATQLFEDAEVRDSTACGLGVGHSGRLVWAEVGNVNARVYAWVYATRGFMQQL